MPNTPLTWIDEQVVNTVTAGTQDQPQIVQLLNGNILVAWTSTQNTGAGADPGLDVIGQIFDPGGDKIAGEFRLNNVFFSADEQDMSLAALPGGGFISVFEEDDGGGIVNIRLNEYDATGADVSANRTVVADAAGAPSYANPAIAVSSATSALIVYQQNTGTVTHISAKTYDPSTNTYSAEFIPFFANSASENYSNPVVATLTNGNYVVVANRAGTDHAIVAHIIQPDAAHTDVLPVTAVTNTDLNTSDDREAQVAALTGGGFVVVWTNTDSSDTDVLYAIYDASGAQQAAGSVDGALSTDNHHGPTVAALSDGGFIVYYDDDVNGVLKAAHYSSAGTLLGSIFNVALSPAGPVSTGLSDGRTAVVWTQADGLGELALEITETRDAPNVPGALKPLVGTINADTVTEAGGPRQYFTGPGNDVLNVGSTISTSTHDGGPGTDTINWSGSTEVGGQFNLQAGTATNAAGTLTERMTNFENFVGTNNADTIVGTTGVNILNGGGGDDVINGGAGNDNLTGGAGADTFRYAAAADSASGSGDQITDFTRTQGDKLDLSPVAPSSIGVVQSGTLSFVFVTAPGGNMQINVTGDVEAFDIITGGIGVTLQGDNTATTLLGSASNDSIFGNGGNDILAGGLGADVLFGGAGADTFKFIASSESNAGGADLIADFVTGTDKIDLSGANPSAIAIIDLGVNSLVFANTAGGQIQIGSLGNVNGNDIVANIGVTIQGGAASSTLTGGSLSDYLFGEGGNDTLIGGAGVDILFGGVGADVFKYNAVSESNAAAADLIADFQTGIDKIDLSAAGMTAAGIANNIVFASGPGGTMQIGSLQTVTLADIILVPGPSPLEAAHHIGGTLSEMIA